MAKKNKNMQVESAPVSKFTGGLFSLIWCNIVMLVCFALATGVGVAALYVLTDFNFDAIGKRAILGFALTGVFATIGMAWAMIKFIKWETKHTIISNNQLKFKATSLQLVGTCLKWGFFTVITFGIFICSSVCTPRRRWSRLGSTLFRAAAPLSRRQR